MEHVFKMKLTDLGSFNLKEHIINTDEGLKPCQDYGKGICEKM